MLYVSHSAKSIDTIKNEFRMLKRDAAVPTVNISIRFVSFGASRAELDSKYKYPKIFC